MLWQNPLLKGYLGMNIETIEVNGEDEQRNLSGMTLPLTLT